MKCEDFDTDLMQQVKDPTVSTMVLDIFKKLAKEIGIPASEDPLNWRDYLERNCGMENRDYTLVRRVDNGVESLMLKCDQTKLKIVAVDPSSGEFQLFAEDVDGIIPAIREASIEFSYF